MKYPSRNRSLLSRGFTLIELLVVVAIIAILAALTVSGIKMANSKANAKETETRIKFLEDCLERYNSDNGEYPKPATPATTAQFLGFEYNIGGASCLYQALTGDGNDQIRGYQPRVSAGESAGSSTGELGSTKGTVYVKDMGGSSKSWFQQASGTWIILDGYRAPFQYKPVDKTRPDETIHNTDYDLWSYGNLQGPGDGAESEKQWIKNW
jgi:prepilin-type N-terminal cleavage/methylation domain-containing protein